ncbi:proton-conducting transporter membrane subunit [Methanoregula sp.]|uniref:proton-conducting transporter transmembrane domain-containing protein n=1 Tax=Methanoregula sp. TaxID=2052170 RepID=UPI002D11C74E|nr:proton-conducting transporter membrane subunit [Methanoregula sp.]HVP95949.1 proton-conducting transporter membrane subunit [Methanoregula sp.]
MILVAFVLTALVGIVLVAISRTHGQMNAAAVGQAIVFAAIALYVLLFVQVPVNTFIVGSGYFFIDHLGLLEVLIATVIFVLAAVYARGYVGNLLTSHELEAGSLKLFYAAWCLLELVIILAFFSDNLALFWIFAEMTTIISAMLVAILSARENIDAALKYIFVASVAMIFAFIGLIFLFEISRSVLGTGTLNWTALMAHAAAFPHGMTIAAFLFIFIGFAAKSGIFPFHTWLPEAHAKAPSAVSAVLSGVLLNVGIYGILRVFAIVHETGAATDVTPVILLFGILSIAIAAISMLPEKNLKKLVAFSSIENMGIMLVGIAIATPLAIFWVLVQVIAHAFTKASLFFSAGILHRQYRSHISADAPDEMCDVFRFQPLAAWGFVLGGLAIIGIPPFLAFFSKFFILLSLGSFSLWVLALVLVLLFIAATALGYFVISMFGQVIPPGETCDIVPYRTPLSMKLPIVVLLALVLILGLMFPPGGYAFITQVVTELRF